MRILLHLLRQTNAQCTEMSDSLYKSPYIFSHKSLMPPLGLFSFCSDLFCSIFFLLLCWIAVVSEHYFTEQFSIFFSAWSTGTFLILYLSFIFFFYVRLVLWCTIAISPSWWLRRQQLMGTRHHWQSGTCKCTASNKGALPFCPWKEPFLMCSKSLIWANNKGIYQNIFTVR